MISNIHVRLWGFRLVHTNRDGSTELFATTFNKVSGLFFKKSTEEKDIYQTIIFLKGIEQPVQCLVNTIGQAKLESGRIRFVILNAIMRVSLIAFMAATIMVVVQSDDKTSLTLLSAGDCTDHCNTQAADSVANKKPTIPLLVPTATAQRKDIEAADSEVGAGSSLSDFGLKPDEAAPLPNG